MGIPENINKILVLQLGGIGDVVLSLPALKALRARFKNADISLLVIGRSAELVRGCEYIDNLFTLNIRYTNLSGIFRKGVFSNLLKVMKELRRNRFDLAINLEDVSSFMGSVKMAVFLWVINAKYSVGRNAHGRGFFFNLKVRDIDMMHERNANLNVVGALGADITDMEVKFPLSEEDIKFVSDFLMQKGISPGDFVIGFNPGAFRPSRKWFNERWADLAEELIKEYKCKIVITGHSSEKDSMDKIIELNSRIIAAEGLSLKQLSALIKRFDLFITNDSGPMHIAAILKTPVIALFGPGDINKFSPEYGGNKCYVVRKEADCWRPCYRYDCRQRECMASITVKDVLGAVRKVLK